LVRWPTLYWFLEGREAARNWCLRHEAGQGAKGRVGKWHPPPVARPMMMRGVFKRELALVYIYKTLG